MIQWARAEAVSDYPPLDFWDDQSDVESGLLGLIRELAWHARDYAVTELRTALGTQLPLLQVCECQNIAYTMPRVRRRQTNELSLLAAHYAPHRLQLGLEAALPASWQSTAMEEQLPERLSPLLVRRFDRVREGFRPEPSPPIAG